MDENGFFWDLGGHITFDHNLSYYKEAVCWATNEWNILTRNCQVFIPLNFKFKILNISKKNFKYIIKLLVILIILLFVLKWRICPENKRG